MNATKLFCLPYAGSSALNYLQWKKYLAPQIEVYPVELPGRGKRFGTAFLNTMTELTDDLFQSIEPELNSKLAFFGHSMGSWVVFELVHKMVEKGYEEPVHLFLSGRYPPHLEKPLRSLHTLSFAEIRADLQRMGGKLQELDCPELWTYFLPMLRADYKVLDLYRYQAKACQLHCDITALTGDQDYITNKIEMEQWQEHTLGRCRVYEFAGKHFFIHDHIQEITRLIHDTLSGDSIASEFHNSQNIHSDTIY